MTWPEFLAYLSEPNGLSVAIGVLWSFAIEFIPTFDTLDPRWKRIMFLVICLVVPVAAAGLGVLTLDWDPDWQMTFWPALVAGALAFGSGTITHIRKMQV